MHLSYNQSHDGLVGCSEETLGITQGCNIFISFDLSQCSFGIFLIIQLLIKANKNMHMFIG